jgi:glycosyltransferase involved in cell wall biosynthesis
MINRPLLDFDSSRDIFLNGMVATSVSKGTMFHVALPSCKKPVNIKSVHMAPLANGFSGDRLYGPFFIKLLVHTKRFLRENPGCIVQHFNSAYRGLDSFDLPSLFGLLRGHPFVVGPAEIPHSSTSDDLQIYMGNEQRKSSISNTVLQAANESLLAPMFMRAFSKTVASCDALIVPYLEAKELYGQFMPASKIKVITYGVDLQIFTYSKPPRNSDLLFVGNLISRKGLDTLILAMAAVQKSHRAAKLHIVGDGPQRNALTELARRLGLEEKIIFHGRLSLQNLISLYRNCRIFCHPSLSEGFCHVNLEAMACGRPVVSTRTVGSFMVADREDGFLVAIRDNCSLAEKIMILLDDYELTLKMGIKARKKVEEKHDWSRISADYSRLYSELAGK